MRVQVGEVGESGKGSGEGSCKFCEASSGEEPDKRLKGSLGAEIASR